MLVWVGEQWAQLAEGKPAFVPYIYLKMFCKGKNDGKKGGRVGKENSFAVFLEDTESLLVFGNITQII